MKRNLLRVGFLSLFFALTTMASAATDATITWAWNDSEASSADSLGMQEAAVSSDLISNCTVTLGESLVYYESGIRSWSDWTLESGDRQYFTEVTNNSGEKITEGSDASTITLSFTVADGYKFTPSNVSMKAERDGTGGGNFDLVWNNATTITSGQLGNRHGTDDSWSDFSFNINADAATGTCTLQIVITNLDNGKSIGFADVVISGTIASENEADEEGNEETVSDEQCLYSTDFTEWVADESAPQVTTDYS
ncbi:MAG: hypothetical protein LUD48_04260, partial [Prevotella sp.]|nr:hypothetical protein [Prevotella sp.]